jgi:hypothetical protein
MTGFHPRCEDESCDRRCRRPGCLEPEVHFLTKLRRVNKRWSALHVVYDCTVPRVQLPSVGSVARQAIEQLNPDMGPSEVAIARRVIGRMLDRLEHLEHTAVTVIDPAPTLPLLLTAAKEPKRPFRPKVVAAPRELTHARAQHLEWLAQKKERTA